jgi:hypothetical protein
MPPDVSFSRFVDGARFLGYNPGPSLGEANLVPGNISPAVRARAPLFSADRTRLALTADTFDDTGIARVSLFYRREGTPEFTEVVLRDDGRNRDGALGDGIFGAVLPPVAPGTTLIYYVRAVDREGQVSFDPGAPTDTAELHRVTLPLEDPGLRISEVVSYNQQGIKDEKDERGDWLEVMNCGTRPADLTGLSLSKNYANPARGWAFPEGEVLQPGQPLVVFCDGQTRDGDFHTDFRLAREGDQVALFVEGERRILLDTLSFGPLPPDTSFGIPACGEEPVVLSCPTPGEPNPGTGVRFRRGDVNGDGKINLGDPIATLWHLFAGGRPPSCLDAADADDSGDIDIGDGVFLLSYLFSSSRTPLPPFSSCGSDPTEDELSCCSYGPCRETGGIQGR